MKIKANKIFFTIVLLLGSFVMFARPTPPAPGFKKPPPPPGLAINDHILSVLIFAILLGLYVVYSNNIKTKTPS